MAAPKLSVGLPVLYTLPVAGPEKGKLVAGPQRPGIVVNVNDDKSANLQVFTNGDGNKCGDGLLPVMWVKNVVAGTGPGTLQIPDSEKA